MIEHVRDAVRRSASIAFAVALAAVVSAAPAAQTQPAVPQEPAREFTPMVGQEGRDVIWVPTREQTVERMLDFAELKPRDVLVDLGSGDGRIVIAAARRGAIARGVEYNPDMVELSSRNAVKAGVADRARFLRANIFEYDFADAQVVTMYLLPGLNLKLRPVVLKMRPGTRIVSHAFTMGDWEADRSESVEGSNQTIYLWIVPADVAGRWTLEVKGAPTLQLSLTQQYQRFEGNARGSGGTQKVARGALRGEQISFSLVDVQGTTREFSGRVNGDRIEGSNGWTAVRAGR